MRIGHFRRLGQGTRSPLRLAAANPLLLVTSEFETRSGRCVLDEARPTSFLDASLGRLVEDPAGTEDSLRVEGCLYAAH